MENSLIWYGREGERRKPSPNVLFTQPWDENQVGNGEIKYDYYFTPYLSQYPSLTTTPPPSPPIFLFLPLKFCYESQNMDFRSKSPLSHTAWPLTKSYHFENTNFPDLSEGPLIIANEALFSRYVNLSPPSIFHLFSTQNQLPNHTPTPNLWFHELALITFGYSNMSQITILPNPNFFN